MKINVHWHRHVEAWRGSGLSQADYCRQQDLNPKALSAWARRELPKIKDAPLEVIAVQVTPSLSAVTGDANVILRFAHDAQLELSYFSTSVSRQKSR